MKGIPALPVNLEKWAHQAIMPAYFFYIYHKGAKSVAGSCSACGHGITLEKVRHNAKIVCPHCGRKLTVKSRGRRGRIYDRETCQENARIYVRLDENGAVRTESYDYSYGDKCWKRGLRPVYYRYSYHYEVDVCAHVYCGDLPAALKETPWQYCPIEPFYGHNREPMEMVPFLQA